MRTVLVIPLALALVSCRDHRTPADQARHDSAPRVTSEPERAAGARAALGRYLELVREGHRGPRAAADSLRGCQMADGQYQPIEMLAWSRILDAQLLSPDGDTAAVRAEVVTVAEEDGSPTAADRYVATQRLLRDTATWTLVRESGAWQLCTGRQYRFWGDEAHTTWAPTGASARTARALADSVWAAESGDAPPGA